MNDQVRHFLVTKRFGRLESVEVYDDADEAMRRYEQRERECGWVTMREGETPAPAECVLLGADRLGTAIATHGNWFDEPSGLEDALRAAMGLGGVSPEDAWDSGYANGYSEGYANSVNDLIGWLLDEKHPEAAEALRYALSPEGVAEQNKRIVELYGSLRELAEKSRTT